MSAVDHAPRAPSTAARGAATMAEAFQATAAAYPDMVALRSHDGAVVLTFEAYAQRVEAIAGGLSELGVGRGDPVALMLTNRPEFHLVDTAAIHLGAIPFSIYNTSAPDQIRYLLDNSAADVVVTESALLPHVRAARGERPSHVVVLEGGAEDGISLAELEGNRSSDFDFEGAWRTVQGEDVLTLIYTSGTTGPPKGVEITHANMLAQCRAVGSVLPFRPGARITSYLPSAHIADRWSSHYSQMVWGIQVTAVPDPRAIAGVLAEVRPTIWGAVPRILEKLKAALEAGLAAEPDEARRAAVLGAINVARQKVRLEREGQPIPAELAAAAEQAEEMVLSKLRAKLGLEQAEWIVVGAAPLSGEVQEFLLALGLPLTEIYGMSECSCCVTVTHPSEARLGSVGRAIAGVELRLEDDGELLVRGSTVMRGYRGQAEQTKKAVDPDGWLRTGDICTVDGDGFVRIVDRKKEIIINAGGKNMSPANIEQELKSANPLIGQAAVIGNGRPYNAALLVLDPDIAAVRASALGLQDPSVASVAADERILAEVSDAVARANTRLARVEQIKRFALISEEWLPGGDELTPTMKLKRNPISDKYQDVIDDLYGP